MYVSRMKSLSPLSPGRESLTTLPEESHTTPSQAEQQSEEGDHEWRSFEGSEMMLRLKWRRACLSTEWHAWETRKERGCERMKRKESRKVLL